MLKKILFIFIVHCSLLSIHCFGQDWQGQGRQNQESQGDRHAISGRYGMSNQGVGVIKGKIIDGETEQAIEYSSVVVYRVTDSTMAGGAISDEKGGFKIENLAYGKYFVKLNFIGYKPKRLIGTTITPKKPVFDVGIIKFNSQSTMLKEAQVIADKPLIEYKLDKKIVNVENNIVTTSGTAVDVLQQIPSVTVDFDGNVSLRGNSNVQILIDGKPTLMTQDQLQEIPASQISSVELITNPSAKYDPDGMAGIIDIKLKTHREKGFNGMVILNEGTGDSYNSKLKIQNLKFGELVHDLTANKYNCSMNFNWLVHKFNIFGSYDVRSDDFTGHGYVNSILTNDNNQTTFQDENDKFLRERISNNLKLGTDYSIDSKNVLTLTGLYRLPYSTSNQYSTTNETGSVNENLYDVTNGNSNWNPLNFNNWNVHNLNFYSLNFNLDYKRTYDKKDKQLTADAIFVVSNRNNISNSNKMYVDTVQSDTIQQTITDSRSNSTTLKLDYTNPLGEHSKIEAGAQARITNSDNTYLYQTYNSITDIWNPDLNLDEIFNYAMQIYSGYGMYSGEYKRYSYQLGLRAEYAMTQATLETASPSEINQIPINPYFELYPSANITGKIDETQSIQLSYSRRVNRPNPMQLNPFVNRSNLLSISYGNPKLQPEFINSYELSYIKYLKKKNTLTGSVFYKEIDNVIKSITEVVNSTTTSRTFDNLSTGESYGIELIGDMQVMKGWRGSLSYSYFRTVINGDVENTQLTNANYSSIAKFNTLINLPNKYGIQLTFNYRGPQVTPQGEMKEMYFADMAVKKDIWKDKATVSVRLSDMLNSQKFESITNTSELYSDSYRKRDSRILYLSFTYRINKQLQKNRNQKRDQQRKTDEDQEEEIEDFSN